MSGSCPTLRGQLNGSLPPGVASPNSSRAAQTRPRCRGARLPGSPLRSHELRALPEGESAHEIPQHGRDQVGRKAQIDALMRHQHG